MFIAINKQMNALQRSAMFHAAPDGAGRNGGVECYKHFAPLERIPSFD